MIQKQSSYYHARFNFSFAPTEGGIVGFAKKLLQRCNYYCNETPTPLPSGPEVGQPIPIQFYLIPQLFHWLKHTPLTMESCEYLEPNEKWGNKHPYYFIKFEQTEYVVATLQQYLPSNLKSFQFYYHSDQFDEFYNFAYARPTTLRDYLFWNRQAVLEEAHLLLKERNYEMFESTTMIPL